MTETPHATKRGCDVWRVDTRHGVHRDSAGLALRVAVMLVAAGCDMSSTKAPSTNGQPAATAKVQCDTDVAEWTEGVKLYNGQEVVVWRRAVACQSGFPNSTRGRELEFELKYELMSLHWKAPSGLKPISFEIIDGAPYIGLYVMTGGHCRDQPPNRPLARVMKWVDGQWVEVPLEQAPVDRALLNLYSEYWGHNAKTDAKGFIPAHGKTTGWKPTMTLKQFFAMGLNQCGIYQERIEPMPPVPKSPASTLTQK